MLFPVQAMHQGVIRDVEQQRIKRERQADFDMQRELEAEYKREQTVRDSTGEAAVTPAGQTQAAGTSGTIGGAGIGMGGGR